MNKLLAWVILLFVSLSLSAQDRVLPKPNPPRLVNDAAQLLTPDQVAALEAKLVAYDDTTSNQIAIVLVKTLNGLEPNDYATELGRLWGIGGKEFNNGVVVLVSTGNDGQEKRKVYIAPGYGLEGAIPDIIAKRIVDREMVPHLQAGNYYRALDEATDALIKAAAGEYKAPAGYRDRSKGGKGIPVGLIVFIVIMVILFSSRGGGGRGGGGMLSRRGYRGWNGGPPVIFPGGFGGGGGGFGGGGGGGGFGGFGGGGFGGGGAGGDW
jgi:uncharacterized protein